MQDEAKTKEQLIAELHGLRQRLADSEKDKAEHQRAEQALRESERMFRVTFNNLRDGLLLADKETRQFLMGNPAIHEMLGYDAEELNLLGVADIHPEQDLPLVIKRFEKLAKGSLRTFR
jgi:PAS domain-containing protein